MVSEYKKNQLLKKLLLKFKIMCINAQETRIIKENGGIENLLNQREAPKTPGKTTSNN